MTVFKSTVVNVPDAPVDPSLEINPATLPALILVEPTILVAVNVSVAKVKSESSVNLPFVVANGILPEVNAISLRVTSFRAAPVVIVK